MTETVSDAVVSKIPLKEKDIVTGMVMMKQSVWAVHHEKSSVQAYPVTLPHQPQTLPIKGLTKPVDTVRFPLEQTQLVISDLNKYLIWMKLKQHKGVWKVATRSIVTVSYTALGLGVCDNQLLVCDNNVVHVLSTTGEETHIVNMPKGVWP